MAYVSNEERRRRIIALVKEKTGMDCPKLEVEDIENAMGSVKVFYWCEGETAGNHTLEHIRLDDEEAERIGINRTRTHRGRPETNQ
jgi:hypothetical protein